MKTILIVGFGNIGTHIYDEFPESMRNGAFIYDPKKGYSEDSILEMKYDFAFICVPTDMHEDGSCNTNIVDSMLGRINADVVIIKSTVPVGFTESMVDKYQMKNIVFSPEYYGTTVNSPKSPNFLVLAGRKEDCSKVAQLYYFKGANFHVRYTDYRTAELAKYMENCFLALKVTFCAEFATIAKDKGVSYPELREIFVLDERMGNSHTLISDDAPYYDSHCLNKDIPALIAQTSKAHLMESVLGINQAKRRNKDY